MCFSTEFFGATDARLQRWIGQFGRAVLSKVRMPDIALDSLAIKRSEVNAWVAGETVPRHFEQVDAVVQLARDYQGLEMHLSGQFTRTIFLPSFLSLPPFLSPPSPLLLPSFLHPLLPCFHRSSFLPSPFLPSLSPPFLVYLCILSTKTCVGTIRSCLSVSMPCFPSDRLCQY